jgi:hypothetical protein
MPLHHRRGSLLIVVMGMIILMLALTIGLASRVSKAIEESGVMQRQAQAFVMACNAKILLVSYADRYAATPALITNLGTNGETIGNNPSTAAHLYADRLGWFRIRATAIPPATATTASITCSVLAAGGSSGQGGRQVTALGPAAGESARIVAANNFDVRYGFTMSATFPTVLPSATAATCSMTLRPVDSNTSYVNPW